MSTTKMRSPLELGMSPNELAIQKTHELLVQRGILPSCVNCELWDEKQELCTKWGRRPPAKVIVIGCQHHIPDIPF